MTRRAERPAKRKCRSRESADIRSRKQPSENKLAAEFLLATIAELSPADSHLVLRGLSQMF